MTHDTTEGNQERRELRHQLAILVAHLLEWLLLKWRFLPAFQGTNWRSTLPVQRRLVDL